MVLLDQTSPDKETRDNREEKYLQLLRWTINGLERADKEQKSKYTMDFMICLLWIDCYFFFPQMMQSFCVLT